MKVGAAEATEARASVARRRALLVCWRQYFAFAVLLPEPAHRERVGFLLRHQDGNLRDGRLTLEDRLRRGAPVVGVPLRDDRIETDVLILQGMDELVDTTMRS